MTLSHAGLFRPHWTKKILNDSSRNILLERPGIDPDHLALRFDAMNRALPDALITVPPALETMMPNHPGDRHVLAAAVYISAPTIVTNNLKHFLPKDCEPYGVEAQNADEFILHLVSLDPIAVRDAILTISLRRTRPPQSPSELLEVMRGQFPESLTALEGVVGLASGW
jgi:hypothetical protein